MKTSLRKLRGLGLHKHNEKRERHLQQALSKLDELSQASQVPLTYFLSPFAATPGRIY